MTKSFVLLLLCCSAFLGFSQKIDSVQVNGEWHYVYPEQQPVGFTYSYYNNFDLSHEFFEQWLQWKMEGDPRAMLKLHDLQDSIQMELYRKLEDNDSIYYGSRKKKRHHDYVNSSYSYKYSVTGKIPRDVYYSYLLIHYQPGLQWATGLPPVVQSLPDGKYVQYYKPWATFEKRKNASVVDSIIACVFELKDDNLNGHFLRLDIDGDTLGIGQFVDGFQHGEWMVISDKDIHCNEELPGKPAERLSAYETHRVTNYQNGLRNGVEKEYTGGRLRFVNYYKNEAPIGESLIISGPDSIVYDPAQVFQSVIAKSGFSEHFASGRYIAYNQEYDGVKGLNYWELEHMEYTVTGRAAYISPMIRYNNVQDSLFCDSLKFSRTSWNYISYPIFESYYKVYDRESGKLLFERYIDTANWMFYGKSYYKNGALMDSVSDDLTEYGYPNFNVYKENGDVIYSNKVKRQETFPVYEINGFKVRDTELHGSSGFILVESTQRGDTLFNHCTWDKNKQLLYQSYEIDSVDYEWVKIADDQYYLSRVYSDISISEFGTGTIKVIDQQDIQSEQHTIRILENEQPFEGEICFKYKRNSGISLRKRQLQVSIAKRERHLSRLKPGDLETGLIRAVMEDLLSELAQMEVGYNLGYLKGGIKNHALNDEVEFSQKHFSGKKVELNYNEGLPSGNVVVYTTKRELSRVYAMSEEIENHNRASQFKRFHKSMKHRYRFKTYSLRDGKKHGPLVFYNPAGDTIGKIPFEHGIKHGKAFHYAESNVIELEYDHDILVNDLTLRRASWPNNYDTLMKARFDENGRMIHGFSISERYDSDDDGIHLITVDLTETQPKQYDVVIRDNRELEFQGVISEKSLISGTVYHGLIPSYSKKFEKLELRGHGIQLMELLANLGVGYEGFIVSNRVNFEYHYRQTNRTVGIYDNYDGPLYRNGFDESPGYFTKYYPNEQPAREGNYVEDEPYHGIHKSGLWKTYTYNGQLLHEITYKDSLVILNGIKFPIKGMQTEFDSLGNVVSKRLLLEELETYECSSDEYYTERQFVCLSSTIPHKMNGWTKNYYDNGTLMNEGMVVNGMPDGLWKFYTPDGKLSRLGRYVTGKQNGKWLKGDLSEKAYIGDVCMDPDDPDYAYHLHQLESDKEIEVVVYKMGEPLNNNRFGNSGGIRGDIQLR